MLTIALSRVIGSPPESFGRLPIIKLNKNEINASTLNSQMRLANFRGFENKVRMIQ